ncbi:hypothetical protein B0I37DRAFT_149929 [Chaetomium sp. MPI-CAGE-AT-0009]|nr:hypothetical protein B0I37DRAFT_149929 [Chaetomium sp. MPI-CAGE-AT-0009]
MNNRTSVRVADGSDNPDYYVTLTVYHELHCLVRPSMPHLPFQLAELIQHLTLQMRFRWFLDPQYYANKTWEEQAADKAAMGHYRHCLWSLLESVLCNGDTSIRTFHWDSHMAAPKPDSPVERKCVNWEWLHNWTMDRSFLLRDRLLSHPTFGRLNENLMPMGVPH